MEWSKEQCHGLARSAVFMECGRKISGVEWSGEQWSEVKNSVKVIVLMLTADRGVVGDIGETIRRPIRSQLKPAGPHARPGTFQKLPKQPYAPYHVQSVRRRRKEAKLRSQCRRSQIHKVYKAQRPEDAFSSKRASPIFQPQKRGSASTSTSSAFSGLRAEPGCKTSVKMVSSWRAKMAQDRESCAVAPGWHVQSQKHRKIAQRTPLSG